MSHNTANLQNNTLIEDVQSTEDKRKIAINKVGIKDIKHPIKIKDKSGYEQHTVANFNMYVDLPHNFKGTHMSRFVEILNQYKHEITVQNFKDILIEMTQKLEAKTGHLEMSFPFFINKKAPVTQVESLLDYHVTFKAQYKNGKISMWVISEVPVTSLCPCSKKISKYGAHNQRSCVTLSANRI